MQLIEKYLNKGNSSLVYYSPYRYLNDVSLGDLIEFSVINPILKEINNSDIEIITIIIDDLEHFFLIKKMEWDSNYLGFDNYKLINVFYSHNSLKTLVRAINSFKERIYSLKKAYFFSDIPSEEINLIQALNTCGFRLVESRLNYYYEGIATFKNENRYSVRIAKAEDAELLKEVAIKMRNKFDRLHADMLIDNNVADNYIGKFAFNSVMGFADYVLIPDINRCQPFGFLALNKPIDIYGKKISKLVLAAIDNTNHKGWLYKLLSESIYLLKEHNADYLTTITQTSNIAAFRTWEKFGFKLGFITNILVYKND